MVRDTELKSNGEFPNSPVVRTQCFHCGGAQVQSLVRELRPCELCELSFQLFPILHDPLDCSLSASSVDRTVFLSRGFRGKMCLFVLSTSRGYLHSLAPGRSLPSSKPAVAHLSVTFFNNHIFLDSHSSASLFYF